MADKFSLRDEYGKILAEAGKTDKDIYVLDADLAKSTKTETFKKAHPERFIDVGISEADMMCTAAGLASCGKKVFCSTFAIFATGRAWDQVRNSIAYPKWPVKVVSTHGGISVGEDGASHQALEDIALMRVIPGMTVIVPSDVHMLRKLMPQIIDYPSYIYMRLPRNKLPELYKADDSFDIGKAKEIKKGKDITIIANGAMVSNAYNTLKRFESMGVDAGLIDMFTVKPLDEELLLDVCSRTKGILVCEEHQASGGLCGAIAEFTGTHKPMPIETVAIDDTFGESGTPDELFRKYGLDEETIIYKGKTLYDRI